MPAVTVYRQRRMPTMVKDREPGVTEVGKIKLGKLGEEKTAQSGRKYQIPQKLPYFTVTTLQRGPDGNFIRDDAMHKALGDDKPTRIPIRLLFNDPRASFQSFYRAYDGKHVWCVGDGETASRREKGEPDAYDVTCTCPHLDPGSNPQCKLNSRLSVLLEHGSVTGGLWVFRTSSFNTYRSISDSLRFLAHATSGQLAGIPLVLTVQPRQVTLADDRISTIYVAGIEFEGTIAELRAEAEKRANSDLKFGKRMRLLELEARQLAAPIEDDDDEVVREFYPEQAKRDAEGDLPEEGGENARVVNGINAGDIAPQPQTSAPTGNLVELWDSYGEQRMIHGREVERFLADQLDTIVDADTLNEFLTANAAEVTPYLNDLADKLRAKLTPEVPAAKSARGGKRKKSSDPSPRRDPDASQTPSGTVEDPGPQNGDPGPGGEKQEANDGLDVVVIWPGQSEQNRYDAEGFLAAYRRRKPYGGPNFQRDFRSVNPRNEAAFQAHIPAGDRD